MGLSELLQKIGDDNYQTQILSRNLIKSQLVDHQAELTFVTAPENMPNILGDCQNIGIVVWLDKDVLKKAQEQGHE